MTDPEIALPTPVDVLTCAVCPHRRADHDAIATRFCSATAAGGSTRGCACRTVG